MTTTPDRPERWRCLKVGCNPILFGAEASREHNHATEHRVAKWPVRSAEGQRRARLRNKTGYYDRYNVGDKSYAARVEGGYLPGVGYYSESDDSLDEIGGSYDA